MHLLFPLDLFVCCYYSLLHASPCSIRRLIDTYYCWVRLLASGLTKDFSSSNSLLRFFDSSINLYLFKPDMNSSHLFSLSTVNISQLHRLTDSSLRRYFIVYFYALFALLFCYFGLRYSIMFSIYHFVEFPTLLQSCNLFVYYVN